MEQPAVVLIGADKGGVGKTAVARTLLDYFAARQIRVRGFDTEVPRGDASGEFVGRPRPVIWVAETAAG